MLLSQQSSPRITTIKGKQSRSTIHSTSLSNIKYILDASSVLKQVDKKNVIRIFITVFAVDS